MEPNSSDLTKYASEKLNNLIQNYERLGQMETDAYRALLEECNRRHSGELNLKKTITFLATCATKGEYATYGGVAAANGREWSYELYRKISAHLGIVLGYCRANGLPPLSAICVDQDNIKTGLLAGKTLDGFIGGMKMYYGVTSVTDKQAFLRQQQMKSFEFHKSTAPSAS